MVSILSGTQATTLAASQSDNITVTAIVLPIKSIFVNKDMKITKIFSNSAADAPPKVFLGSMPPQELAITEAVLSQFLSIKAVYNLNKIGQVYNSTTQGKAVALLTSMPSEFILAASKFNLNNPHLVATEIQP